MPCYRPNLILFDTSHKPKWLNCGFVSANTSDFLGYEHYDKVNEDFKIHNPKMQFVRVPCGQCQGCFEAKTREKACRAMLQCEESEHNWHITLTYDEYHLPCDDELVNKHTGEVKFADNPNGVLRYRDFQLFKKNLLIYWQRKFKHTGIKFMMCGEYGGQTLRPHYHVIFFNLPIPPEELKVHNMTKNGPIYTCDRIQKIWNKGFISITEVNWDICAYVARYVLKKRYGHLSQDEYFDADMVPEFAHYSTKPAIGRKWFDENYQKAYENDEIILKGHATKIQSMKPPKYYDKLMKEMHPEFYEALAVRRKQSVENKNKLLLNNTTLTEKEYLKVLERQKKDKMSCFNLQRSIF